MRGRIVAAAAGLAAGALVLTGCQSDADTVSDNLHYAVEQFEVQRVITAINGITDTVMLRIEGRCSVESTDSDLGGGLEIVCKIGPNEYTKHFVGLSDNVTYVVQQVEAIDASVYHHRVILKPENILPEFDYEGGEQ
jgi:hypothetical protein